MVCLTIYNQFSPSLCYHCRWHYRNWHISLEFEPFTLLYRRVFSFFKGEGGQETRGRKRGGEKFQKNYMFIFTFQTCIFIIINQTYQLCICIILFSVLFFWYFLVLCPFFTRNDIHVKIYYKVLAIEQTRNICNLISTKLLKLINNILGLISNPSPFFREKVHPGPVLPRWVGDIYAGEKSMLQHGKLWTSRTTKLSGNHFSGFKE